MCVLFTGRLSVLLSRSVTIRGGKRGTGFPKKGKRLGMQVACVSRASIRPRERDKLYDEARPKGSP